VRTFYSKNIDPWRQKKLILRNESIASALRLEQPFPCSCMYFN
jgi:hypothetical protein